MPNLVGIGNSQVPTNAMLGGLAYQDPNHAILRNFEPGDITAIDQKKDDSITAVFVYNTANDSDGGAWRKRTQDTSWYNEPPSWQRGSRKEFPAIAIIVATASEVKIYDGDSPDCPMWMLFQRGDYGQAAGNIIEDQNITDIHMLNAQLVVAQDRNTDSYGSPVINFISETILYMDPNTGEGGKRFGNIAGRNLDQEKDHYVGTGERGILLGDSRMHCITQHVFPNSETDPMTGLPRPSIIVGPAAKLSVVHSNLGVQSGNSISGGEGVLAMTDVNEQGQIAYIEKQGNPIYVRFIELKDKGAVANATHTRNYRYYNLAVARFPSIPWGPGTERVCWAGDRKLALSNAAGCNLYLNGGQDNSTVGDNGKIYARLQSEYPPAFLAMQNVCCLIDVADKNSTDDGHLTNLGNLISNGNFASNISGWNDKSGSGSSISHDSGNQRMALNGAVAYARATTSFTTIVGEYYHVEARGAFNAFATNQYMSLTAGTAEYPNSGYNALASAQFKKGTWDDNEPLNITFRATATTTWIKIESGFNVAVDDVYAYRCDGDKGGGLGFTDNFGTSNVSRQLHKGAIPYGNILRRKYSSNSDIVTYQLSSNQHLEQSYNQRLDFLQNSNMPYTVMCWAQPTSAGGSGWSPLISLDHWNGSKYLFWGTINGLMSVGDTACGQTQIEQNGFYHLCWVKGQHGASTNQVNVYVNGVYDGNASPGGNYVAADHQTLLIGARHNNAQISPYVGGTVTDQSNWENVALVRISQGAISADDVKEIFMHEQQLFRPNCRSLTQSSVIRDVDYDKSTETLHLLTSSGRDDFHGLQRINSTSESAGVSARISANGGMVVEGEP